MAIERAIVEAVRQAWNRGDERQRILAEKLLEDFGRLKSRGLKDISLDLPDHKPSASPSREYSVQAYTLRKLSGEKVIFGERGKIYFSPQPAKVLRFLTEHPNEVIPFDTLVQEIGITRNNLQVVICRMRDVLEFNPKRPRFIKTIRKRGYLFVPPRDPVVWVDAV